MYREFFRRFRHIFLIGYLLLPLVLSQAQNGPDRAIITADNIHELGPVIKINYVDDEQTQLFNTGWFVMDDDGVMVASVGLLANGQKRLALWRVEDVVNSNAIMTWDTSEDIASMLITDVDNTIWIAKQSLNQTSLYRADISFDAPLELELVTTWATTGTLLEMWTSDIMDTDGRSTYHIGMEFAETIGSRIMQFQLDGTIVDLPYAPDNDASAVVRIGRIPLPYVVTSSLEGVVTLWQVDTVAILYQADNMLGEPSVFGNINAEASHLVWRDNANQRLYLLEFITGMNQNIAELNGDYAQWYFLSHDASVIMAVNLGFEPNVFAWIVETGERINLGAYRDCSRPQPDMTRLSADGTTLIIGCDTGLEIWRINETD